MKKLIIFNLIIAFLLSSCSSYDKFEDKDQNEFSQSYSKFYQLKEINDSISQVRSQNVSRGIGTFLAVVSADVLGAGGVGYYGSKLGAAIGGAITGGSGAVPGAAIGGMIGAAVGGIGSSYGMYKGCGGIVDKLPTMPLIANSYAQTVQNSAEGTYIRMLDLPVAVDSLENIGYFHNKTLDYLISQDKNGIMPMNDDLYEAVDDDEILVPSVFSDFEMSILKSEEFETAYNEKLLITTGDYDEMLSSIDNDNVRSILGYYLDALSYYSGMDEYDDLIMLTNEYISIIDESDTLTQIEKEILYMSLAVGVYSYKYWTEYYGE